MKPKTKYSILLYWNRWGHWLGTLLLLLLVFASTRFLIRALPGDPLETLLAESGSSIPREHLAEQLGLNRPFLSSLWMDLKNWLHGDWGISLLSREPIAPLLKYRLLRTLVLTLYSLGLGLPVSIFLGLRAATRPCGWADRFCDLFGSFTAALPTPWIGPMLMILFAVWIPLVPIGAHWALPTMTLAVIFSGFWSRLIRVRVRDSLKHGSSQGARARGIPEWKVLLKYGLAPVAGPLLGYLGTQFGSWMAGAFVTEVIFNWKGMGMLLIEAVLRRDYPVVEAATFVSAAICILSNRFGDWMQRRFEREG